MFIILERYVYVVISYNMIFFLGVIEKYFVSIKIGYLNIVFLVYIFLIFFYILINIGIRGFFFLRKGCFV